MNNGFHSVTLIDPEQSDVDAVIKFCQYCEKTFNVYVYTPNMNNNEWLSRAVEVSDAIIVNTRTENYKSFCLLEKTHYYGPKLYMENSRKLSDPLHYFATYIYKDK